MSTPNRRTGIDAIGDAPWGAHFCLLYQTRQDLIDILAPYFAAGLANNESCIWVTSDPLNADDARQALAAAVDDLDSCFEKGQIEILDYSQWYTPSGTFEADAVLRGWVEKEKQALARGFDGLRATGNTSWLDERDWRAFTDYEAAIDREIGGHRMLAICTYLLDRCGASEIIDVVANHQFALIRREGRWETIGSAERERAEEALRAAHAELEERIAQRTGELATANEALQAATAEHDRAKQEVQMLNKRLERRLGELNALNKELEAFSHSVSHDLRAPLRGVDGFCKALMADCGAALDERGRHYVDRICAGCQRMAELIEDLLKLSRVTATEMSHEPVDLSGPARNVAAELSKSQPDRRVEWVVADGLVAEGDRRLLRILLQHLLDNAWKFTNKHPTARIELGATDGGGGQVFFVRDDGAGFDMQYAHKLFAPFQRLHPQAEFAGTGIGLATVQRIVHRHGGRVWAEAAVEQGATFSFTL